MKKYFFVLLSFVFLSFVACKNIPKQENLSDLEIQVASELMLKDENYSNETLKAISVVLRTNILVNGSKTYNFKADEKYTKIANQTKNQILKNKQNNLVEISFENNENYKWQKSIKKSDLLEFALKNNISLTNLSKINPIFENNKVLGLEIGNKYFDYENLAKEFKLESNMIENITQNKNEIIISGKNKGFYGFFDIEKCEQLSNNNYFYKDILSEFFDNLTLINN